MEKKIIMEEEGELSYELLDEWYDDRPFYFFFFCFYLGHF